MPNKEAVLKYHNGGKISLGLPRPLANAEDLSLAYTPGVGMAVRELAANPESAAQYSAKGNLVAVVTDGSAILGLGDLGPTASIPVMEGKAVLFKAFGDVDGWPVPLDNCRVGGARTGKTDPQRIIDAVLQIAPMYGGINLEDIAAPACFEIEDKLDELLDIPVFHDDQWGTAIITLAGVKNYAILSERKMADLRVVINGAGAAGTRIRDMLLSAGVEQIIVCDSKGVIHKDRPGMDPRRAQMAVETSARTLSDAIKGAHVFIGVSVADCVTADDVRSMAHYPAIFAMANPDPEIRPDAVAAALGDKPHVVATGRSDYPNQINNVLCFPFLFRGALDAGARTINTAMKIAAAEALAKAVHRAPSPETSAIYSSEKLSFGPGYIIPKPFDRQLFIDISLAVARAAVESGVARIYAADLQALEAELIRRNQKRV
jgi:malate dehydrogenase (oxaloacetate-decarboxylating)(NADP+)